MNVAEKIYELVKGMPEEEVRQVLTFAESLQQKAQFQAEQNTTLKEATQAGRLLSDYAGILKDSPTFQGDPVEIQSKLRNEWAN